MTSVAAGGDSCRPGGESLPVAARAPAPGPLRGPIRAPDALGTKVALVRGRTGRSHKEIGMASIQGIFGIHEQALRLRGERASVLAANLANADTPHYKARDLDFRQALAAAGGGASLAVATTRPGHLAAPGSTPGGGQLMYRVPFQPSLDGNTVEGPVELSAFGENAVRYQASLMFINRKIAGIELALTGR
jgi:flagellar basal-body rod protein FlgB